MGLKTTHIQQETLKDLLHAQRERHIKLSFSYTVLPNIAVIKIGRNTRIDSVHLNKGERTLPYL